MEQQANSRCDFNEHKLPWIVAAAALVLYLATLNHWVTVASIGVVAKVAHWDWWSLNLQAPLFYIITYPTRFLPTSLQLLALNVFSAACGAAALGLLARSVAMLPHDRTRDQRIREQSEYSLLSIKGSWIPPVLATAAFALQLTMWEHSTAATGEAFNLLLFAYVVYSLLAFRLDQKECRLFGASLVFGLAITNNWAMIGFAPLFLVALIWIRGLAFFNFSFLIRMLCFGLAGLLIYLVLPIAEITTGDSGMSFWELMRMQFSLQKKLLLSFPRYALVLCALSSLLPVFVIGFRWRSTVGDTSIVGNVLTLLMFRVVHILFLVVCLWVMFDPPFSPRARGMGWPFLPFYFLSALSAGYCAGYFLLVFGTEPERRHHHGASSAALLGRALAGLVWVAVIAIPAALVYQNWPNLKENGGQYLSKMAQALTENLPSQGAILMSDEPLSLYLVQAHYARNGQTTQHILVDTRTMPYKSYHKSLRKHYGSRWPDVFAKPEYPHPVEAMPLTQMMTLLSRSNVVYYLNPSQAHYMEGMYAEPAGAVYRLHPYTRGLVTAPPLSSNVVAFNQAYWTQKSPELRPLASPTSNDDTVTAQSDAFFAMRFFSRAVNYWGVELQKQGLVKEAGEAFDLALALNDNNEVALINQRFNRNLAKGLKAPVELEPTFEEKLRLKYRTWSEIIRANGPFDEPHFTKQMGENLALGTPSLIRQSAQQFLRVLSLDPGNMESAVWLANMYLKSRQPDKTLELIKTMRQRESGQPLSLANQHELTRLEAWAYSFQTNLPAAVKVIEEARQKDPGEPSLPETLSQIYLQNGQFTNALTSLEHQLKLDPNNLKALFNKGALLIQLRQFEPAIGVLSRVLESEPKNDAARMNRAIANLQSGKLDDAESDYKILLELIPDYYRAYYGLGEIARKRNNREEAVKAYENYLRTASSDAEETQIVRKVLAELKGGSAAK